MELLGDPLLVVYLDSAAVLFLGLPAAFSPTHVHTLTVFPGRCQSLSLFSNGSVFLLPCVVSSIGQG